MSNLFGKDDMSSGSAVADQDGSGSKSSYGQIVKSSSIMGGVAALSLVLSMIRTKFAAVLIGATGTGLLANFVAVQGLFATVSGLGIQSSAVRDVASAYAKGDSAQIGRAVLTLRRSCWITGVVGALALLLLSPWVSKLTFGSHEYQWQIAALGITILLGNLYGGQVALIQGTRRIADLARIQILAGAGGTGAAIACYFWLGLRGLVPALLISAVIQLVLAWTFARQVPVPVVTMSYRDSFMNARGMVSLGIAMMWTGLVGSAVAYGINIVITHHLNLQAVGIYSAAMALSGVFASFVLNAMGSDYYPRLTGVADNDAALNRLVNEQTEVGLLLAAPGLVATITLAPWIVQIFYTREFLPAATLLQWFTLGCLGRVIGWPLGYLLMAKAKGKWLIGSETTIHAVHLALVYVGVELFGLRGAALAFFLVYLLYTAMVFLIGRKLTSFAWSRNCAVQIGYACGFMAIAWLVAQLDSVAVSTAIAIPLVLAAGVHSIIGLTDRLGMEHRITRLVLRLPLVGRLAMRKPTQK